MHFGWSRDESRVVHLLLLLDVDAPWHVETQAVQRLEADMTVLGFDWAALPEPSGYFQWPRVEQQVAGLLHGIGQKPAEAEGEFAREAAERFHDHEYTQAHEHDSVMTEARECYLAPPVVVLYIRSHQPAVGSAEFPRYLSHCVHVARGNFAGLGLGSLWTLTMTAERLLLAVGLGGEKGFRSAQSTH